MRSSSLTFAIALLAAACAGDRTDVADSGAAAPAAGLPPVTDTAAGAATANDSVVTVDVRDADGRTLGTLSLTQSARGVSASGRLAGLPPGPHAIHLHATGRCEPPFESAGGHWNPTNQEHGSENPNGPHHGDFPNITVGSDSTVSIQVTSPDGRLRGGNGLLDADGAAVVVHARPDDYRTNPSGNAGDRIACGVVSS